MKQKQSHALLHANHNLKYVLIGEGLIVGMFAGIVSIIYRFLLGNAEEVVYTISTFIQKNSSYLLFLFLFLFLLGILISLSLKYEPFISGSGIPQIEGEVCNHINQVWWRVLASKITAGTLSVLGGLSLGREGPSIQLGGMCGKGFAKACKRIRIEERYLITCGAAAGLSAAFNAPLAGILFALEEIHKNFSMSVLVSVMGASIMGDFLSQYVFGLTPALQFTVTEVLPLSYYILILILGVVCGMLAAGYNYCTLKAQDLYAKIPFLKSHQYIFIPLFFSGIFMLVLPEILCGGHHMIVMLQDMPMISTLLFLLIMKFLFSLLSFGSGAPGGIFFPLLVLGSYIGAIYGSLCVDYLGIESSYIVNFIIIAMAGFFSGIVRAPITGIVLIAEMTRSLSHLLSLSLVSIVAYVVAHYLKSKPIYESLLGRLLQKNGIHMEEGSEQKRIVEVVVEIGSAVEGKLVRDIDWPAGCLLVGIRKGEEECLPKGDTIIHSSDTIIAMLDMPGATLAEGILQEYCKEA